MYVKEQTVIAEDALIPFLNDGITLTKNAFVVAQFIAPLIPNIRCALKCHKYSVMAVYLSDLV